MEENLESQTFRNSEREYMVSNLVIHQIITYFVVLFLCSVTVFSCIWMLMIIKEEGFLSIGGIPVIIFFAGYSSYVGIQVLRFRTARVAYHQNGFSVTKNGNVSKYSWSEITKTKYYGIARVLRLFGNNGKTIYAIHGITRDNRKFMNKISETVGYTTDVF
ncbi:hypothetical protein [Aquimarina sp. AU474]|uniref:hypothetical protein n=1 Tax=Aquimarina sp. AU474 TaxID=2108529 RepID=UPI000D69DE16|nr:hypothetical protein [Aquimarina sp. AU474]